MVFTWNAVHDWLYCTPLSAPQDMLTGIANEPLIICERIKGLLIHDQEEIWAILPLLFQENLHADIRKESLK